MEENNELISWSDFAKIEMRVGTVVSAKIFKEAKGILMSFIIEEKGRFRDKFFRLFDNSLYSRKFRNLQEH